MMGFSVYFNQKHNFMLTRLSGDINNNNLRNHVLNLNKLTEGVSRLREIADGRKIENISCLTVEGTTIGAELESNKPGSLLAIVVPDSPSFYGVARVYQTFAGNQRKGVILFYTIRDALTWLGYGEVEIKELITFVETVNNEFKPNS